MKRKYLAIVFLIVIMTRPAFFVGCFSYFQLNLDHIVEVFCVNKERPELHCNGKCYLMQQLSVVKQHKEQDQHDSAIASLIEAFVPVFIFPEASSLNYVDTATFPYQSFLVEHLVEQTFYLRYFRPPIS